MFLVFPPSTSAFNSCQKFGINSAAFFSQDQWFYQKSSSFNMGWTLEIADCTNPQATISGLQRAAATGQIPIIRIGVGNSAYGCTDPNAYVSFLQQVAPTVSTPVYAIAGPNEPDAEHWAGPSCVGDPVQIDCIAQTTTSYMNSILARRWDLPTNVRLVSPAFNITSWTFTPIIQAMKANNARFSDLDAVSGNVYNLVGHTIEDWLIERNFFSEFPHQSVIFTEIGDFDKDFSRLASQVTYLKSQPQVISATFFNGFNTNSGWSQFALSDSELSSVLGTCSAPGYPLNLNLSFQGLPPTGLRYVDVFVRQGQILTIAARPIQIVGNGTSWSGTVEAPAPGTYDVFVRFPPFLQKKVTSTTNSFPTPTSIITGDFNVDYYLNLLDISRLLSHYTQIRRPLDTPDLDRFDVNHDNFITIADIALILTNYSQLQVPADR